MGVESDVVKLKRVVYGDGNGNKGLVRKLDAVEIGLRSLRKQSWFIIALLCSMWLKTIISALMH